MPELSNLNVHKHSEFFFPDGNIVLTTGHDPTVAFRLHKSIVNRWSPVFRGMLNALEVASDPWTFLDCDVLIFDDDPTDFERLIRVLYDGTYVSTWILQNVPSNPRFCISSRTSVDCSPTSFPRLASLLQLSHKYDIPHLKAHTLNHLLAAYPLTLSGWDSREAYAFSPSARHDRLSTLRTQRPHPLVIVGLALRVGAPHLLVPAYLDLARFPVSEIISGYTLIPSTSPTLNACSDRNYSSSFPHQSSPPNAMIHLPTVQTTAVLRGKETLQRFIADFIKASVENRVQSPMCHYIHLQVPENPLGGPQHPCAAAFARVCHELLVMTAGVSGGVDSDPLFVLQCSVEILKEDIDKSSTVLGDQDASTATGEDPARNTSYEVAPVVSGQHREERTKEGACVACIESFKQTVDAARQHIWDSLPKWFDLRKFIENGFEEGWE